MGQEVTKAVLRHPRLQLVAGVDVRHVGEDVGALLLGQPVGVTVQGRFGESPSGKRGTSRR
jgi:dihydrodipicolinate reductase